MSEPRAERTGILPVGPQRRQVQETASDAAMAGYPVPSPKCPPTGQRLALQPTVRSWQGSRAGGRHSPRRAQGARAVWDSGGAAGAARSWRLRKSCRARRFWKSMSASVMAAFQQLSPAQRKSISLRSVVTMVK